MVSRHYLVFLVVLLALISQISAGSARECKADYAKCKKDCSLSGSYRRRDRCLRKCNEIYEKCPRFAVIRKII